MSYDTELYRAYAREHDVKMSQSYGACLWKLAGGRGKCPWNTERHVPYLQCRCADVDHTSVWKRGRELRRITTEPYGIYDLGETLERAASIGVEVRVLPPERSMWYPCHTYLVEFVAPEVPDFERLERVRARLEQKRRRAEEEWFERTYGELFVDHAPAGWSR